MSSHCEARTVTTITSRHLIHFDQTLSFNDSGFVLSELIGAGT
jgi:hypothetical protein